MASSNEIIELTREQLYERVWSTPGQKLALEFGISDVALAKTCKRFGIPRPSRGYWAKLAAGEPSPKPPLISLGNSAEASITFDVTKNRERQQLHRVPLASNQSEHIVELSTNEELHPAAEKILRTILSAKCGLDGMAEGEGWKASHSIAHRVAHSAHALIAALQEQGITFVTPANIPIGDPPALPGRLSEFDL